DAGLLSSGFSDEPDKKKSAAGDAIEETTAFDKQSLEFFQKQVKPILQANCFSCHGGKKNVKGGLRLTSREGILKGGDSGPAVSEKDPDESLLLEAINYQDYEMPPKGKLPQKQIEILTRWVKMKLPWPPGVDFGAKVEKRKGPPVVDEQAKRFWSFQPVKRPNIPAVKNKEWVKTPIDAFILARLDAAGLTPSKPAAKTELLRRAYYDLTGLPPEPEDVDLFLADHSPEAFETIIDRLLESPHYGERWGRHWLDLVRYAETNSYERDGVKPFVWRYRDYVIRSFNEDKPYDRFIREQIAGDELKPVTPDGIIATGYYRLGIWDDEPVDPKQVLYDDLDDIISTTGQVFLGLTIGCARCHDHKLDPFPQQDYYSFLAFFRNIRRYGDRAHDTVLDASVRFLASPEEQKKHQALIASHKQKQQENQKQLKEIERLVRKDFVGVEKDEFKNEQARIEILKKRVPKLLSEEQFQEYVALTQQRDELRKFKAPELAQALCIKEHGPNPPVTHVLIRGNPHAPGKEVQPGFPSVLSPEQPKIPDSIPDAASSGRRLVLANWISAKVNPLTSRVMVNRIWQYHFGRGIVRTPSNFGYQGTLPTHPELLDWLAAEFVAHGWRMKHIHKLIMLSNVYQQSSRVDETALAIDTQNDLFWRFNMRRLEAEELRDSLLAVNGRLNRNKMFGPSIYTVIPAEVLAGQSRPGSGWGKSSP
ncbi:MAG: PSD1 domain-containing protein, partial [Planctomycetes bacterium]|nr:PSD1 domain-containing protein [Planctomycetota bacterium]